MFRSSLLFLALAFMSGFMVAAPPAKDAKDTPPADGYFPTKKGTKWVYEGTDTIISPASKLQPKLKSTYSLLDESIESDKTIYSLGHLRKSGKVAKVREVIASKEGLYQAFYYKDKLRKPVLTIRYPVKIGDQWDVETDTAFDNKPIICHFHISKYESVATPLGTYKCICIEEKSSYGDKDGKELYQLPYSPIPVIVKYWYAQGIGMVKHEVPGNKNELIEFEVGKE